MIPETLSSMFEAFGNPQQRHAIMVHLPIALSLLGFVALVLLALTRGRSRSLGLGCVALYALGTGSGWMAQRSGEAAMDRLNPITMAEPAVERLDQHEEMGERVWLLFLVTTACVALLGIIEKPQLRVVVMTGALLTGLVAMGYVAVTAHHGGALVYQHGVGVPTSQNNLKPPPFLIPQADPSDSD